MALYRPTDVGLHDAWRAVNDAVPTTLHGVGKAFPGMAWAWQGNIYQYVRNRSGGAMTEGQGAALYFAAAGRIGNLTANSTKAIIETDDTFVLGDLVGAHEWPGYVFSTIGTTLGERRQIYANNAAAGASTITVAGAGGGSSAAAVREGGPVGGLAISGVDAYDTLPDATTDYSVFCPWEVVKTDLDALITSRTQGVVISTSITDGNLGVIQITGPAIALVDGTTDLVAGDSIIPDAAAGVFSKWAVGAPDANGTLRREFIAGWVIDPYTTDAVDRRHVCLTGRNAIYPHPVTL